MPNRFPLLLVLLLLSGLLLAAAGAQGASAGPAASTSAFEEDFEGFEDELEVEESEEEAMEAECETAREEASEGELELDEADEICAEAAAGGKRKKGAGSASVAPEECLLRSAHAHAVLDEANGKLKLTLGYTTYEPVGARIKMGNVATVSRQLGRSGVLRIVEPVGERRVERLVVSLRLRAVKSAGCPFRRLVLFPR